MRIGSKRFQYFCSSIYEYHQSYIINMWDNRATKQNDMVQIVLNKLLWICNLAYLALPDTCCISILERRVGKQYWTIETNFVVDCGPNRSQEFVYTTMFNSKSTLNIFLETFITVVRPIWQVQEWFDKYKELRASKNTELKTATLLIFL